LFIQIHINYILSFMSCKNNIYDVYEDEFISKLKLLNDFLKVHIARQP